METDHNTTPSALPASFWEGIEKLHQWTQEPNPYLPDDAGNPPGSPKAVIEGLLSQLAAEPASVSVLFRPLRERIRALPAMDAAKSELLGHVLEYLIASREGLMKLENWGPPPSAVSFCPHGAACKQKGSKECKAWRSKQNAKRRKAVKAQS